MTHEERAEIERVAPTSTIALSWRPDADPRFTRLTAQPCPLLVDGQCSVYAVRPLICRQFMCGRVSTDEPFETDAITGCGNLTARLYESERFRQHYATNGRKELQRWGKAHGWTS